MPDTKIGSEDFQILSDLMVRATNQKLPHR